MSKQYVSHKKGLPEQTVPQAQSSPVMIGNQSMEALISGQAAPSVQNMGHQVDLPATIREKMENSFGADLSGVRLYESAAVSEAGAQAITRGSDIAFAPGKLDLTSSSGQALLGHELSHVVSQARGQVSGNGFLNDHALEARADREGALAAAGESVYSGSVTPLSASSVTSAAGPMQAKKITDKDRYDYAEAQLTAQKNATNASKAKNAKAQDAARELAAQYSASAFDKTNSTTADRVTSRDQMKLMSKLFRNRVSERDTLMQEVFAEDIASGAATLDDADSYNGNSMIRPAIALSQVSQDRNVNKGIIRALRGSGPVGSRGISAQLSQEKRDAISNAMAPVVESVMNFDMDSLNLDDVDTLSQHTDFITRIAIGAQGISDLGQKDGIRFSKDDNVHEEFRRRAMFMNTAYKRLENYHTNRMISDGTPDDYVQAEYLPTTQEDDQQISRVKKLADSTFSAQLALGGGTKTYAAFKEHMLEQNATEARASRENALQSQLRKARVDKGTREKPKYEYDVSHIPEELRMQEPQKKWWQFWK